MRSKSKFLYILLLIAPTVLVAATVWSMLEKGNKAYFSKDYEHALSYYLKARAMDSTDAMIPYNMACAYYKNKAYDRAIQNNDSAIAMAEDNAEVHFKALTNKGNALYQKKEYDKSVEAYKQSLRIHPGDDKTKYNLAMALYQLKKNPQSPQKDNKDKNKDNDNKDKQDNKKDNNDEKNKENKDPDKEKSSPKEKDKDKSSEKDSPSQSNMDKDIKTQMLKMIDQQEKEVNRRLMQGDKGAISGGDGKDW